jgi:hypothetical protein
MGSAEPAIWRGFRYCSAPPPTSADRHSVAVPEPSADPRRAALEVFLRKPSTDRIALSDRLNGGLPRLTDEEADLLTEWCLKASKSRSG